MADQFDNNARSPQPEAEIDDPLAELARIIGYDRPSEAAPRTEDASQSNEFDLEAELMRELDMPLAPSVDELDRIEADEALDAMLTSSGFDESADNEDTDEAAASEPTDGLDGERDASDDAGLFADDQRSSEDLLRAIENEFAFEDTADEDVGEITLDEDAPTWATSEPDPEPTEFAGEAPEPEQGEADVSPDIDPDRQSADEGDVYHEAVAPDASADMPNNGSDSAYDDDVLADMVRFELPSNKASETEAADTSTSAAPEPQQPASGEGSDSGLDFEEYLSAELDVYGQEMAMDGEMAASEDSTGPAGEDAAAEYDGDRDFDVETALDALNDSSIDDDVAVFDDAAEELLAAINDDTIGSGSAQEVAAQPSPDSAAEWSLDDIEDGAAEELDEELGDMFTLPERDEYPSDSKVDAGDDLEFDLEEILADSIDGEGGDWAEPLEAEAETSADEEVVEPDDWLSGFSTRDEPAIEAEPARRDEIAEAFVGFMPASASAEPETAPATGQPAPAPAAAPSATTEPHQSDWLEGFETADHVVEPGADDYYFDPDLIAESDDTVEMVPDFGVPELVNDEPQPVEPDYDTEIEREFADMIDRGEPGADDGLAIGAGAAMSAAESWNRDPAAPRSHEVSDDYIALERELNSGVDHAAVMAATQHLTDDRPVGQFGDVEGAGLPPERSETGSRGTVLAVAVLAVALLAGLGAVGWSMFFGEETSADGGPRIIRADKDPVKVLPENPGGVTVPNQDKAVYDRVAGGDSTTNGQPALVNSAEEPVDVVQRTLDPEILPLEGRTDFGGEKSEDRLTANGGDTDVAANGAAAPVVSPRKVRTMIVKPDGSIVAREDPAPEAPAAEAEPQAIAAAAPATDTPAETALAGNNETQAAADTAQTQDQASGNAAETASAPAATEGTVAPVRVVKTQPIRPVANAPVPQGRPADQPVNVVGTVSQNGRVGAAPAAATPAAAPQPVEVASAPATAAPAANPGGYYVQIASQPTVEGAQASWQTLSNRYSSVLGGRGVDIQRADIPGKGVFHRVRVPAGTRDQANALCSRYKAAGGSCFVSR